MWHQTCLGRWLATTAVEEGRCNWRGVAIGDQEGCPPWKCCDWQASHNVQDVHDASWAQTRTLIRSATTWELATAVDAGASGARHVYAFMHPATIQAHGTSCPQLGTPVRVGAARTGDLKAAWRRAGVTPDWLLKWVDVARQPSMNFRSVACGSGFGPARFTLAHTCWAPSAAAPRATLFLSAHQGATAACITGCSARLMQRRRWLHLLSALRRRLSAARVHAHTGESS